MTRRDRTTRRRAKGLWIGVSGGTMLLRRLSAAIAQRATEAMTPKTRAAYKPSRHRARRRRLRLTSDLKPYWGKPAVRNFRGGEGNGMDGLAAICHEAQKGGYIGSRWPYASSRLLSTRQLNPPPSKIRSCPVLWLHRLRCDRCRRQSHRHTVRAWQKQF
jgi:hypothetical protein